MLNKLLKSVLDQDRAPIVVCNTDDIIIYMNPSAKSAYHKDLTGSNIKDCHPKEANEKIPSNEKKFEGIFLFVSDAMQRR